MNHQEIRRALADRVVYAAFFDFSRFDDIERFHPYQLETLQAIETWLSDPDGTRRAYIEHATGLGKTLIFAAIVGSCRDLRVLVIEPTKVLVRQTAQRLFNFTEEEIGHLSSQGVIRDRDGDTVAVRGHEGRNVVVTTDMSFIRRSQELKDEFNPHLIIWDECHWSYPPEAQRALALFDEAAVIGFSATPDYLTNAARNGYVPVTMDNGQVLYGPQDRFAQTHFATRLDHRSVRWGIRNGYLAPLAWGTIEFDLSLDSVPLRTRETGLDYAQQQLHELMAGHWPIMCETIRRLYVRGEYNLADRQVVAVCPKVEMAERLALVMSRCGIAAACISGETPDRLRNDILSAFDRRDLRFLATVRVLREGWNTPVAEVMMILAPTRSHVNYVQPIGRVLRPRPGKVALVLDALYQRTTFAPLSVPALFGDPTVRTYTAGEIVVDKDSGEAETESPYLPRQAQPRLVVVPALEVERLEGEVYPTWEEASAAARRLGIRSVSGYRQKYREDPRLPGDPYRTYFSVWNEKGGWPGFLGTVWSKRKRSDTYPTWEQASAAARRLGIRNYEEYHEQYKQDPLLPSDPPRAFAFFWHTNGGWPGFLGVERKLKRAKDFYPTWEQASAAARRLGFRTGMEYFDGYKEDPRLPNVPARVYSSVVWHAKGGWPGFLGTPLQYRTYKEASAAARRLGVRTRTQYVQKYRLDPRLVHNPDRTYSSVWNKKGGWAGFLGTTPYPTWEEASAAARRLGVCSSTQHHKRYKEDPRLPCVPDEVYSSVWKQNGGWPGFLGTSRTKRRSGK